MTQEYHNTKKRSFKHSTKEIGISRSTLYNELARGSVEQSDTNLRTYKNIFMMWFKRNKSFMWKIG